MTAEERQSKLKALFTPPKVEEVIQQPRGNTESLDYATSRPTVTFSESYSFAYS